MNKINQSFDTKCVHSGIGDNEFGAVVPPIYQTSTFKFDSVQQGAKLFAGEEKGYIYTRMANPTVEALENCIADLEGGYKGLGCASGMAAIHTVFAALTSEKDHFFCWPPVSGPCDGRGRGPRRRTRRTSQTRSSRTRVRLIQRYTAPPTARQPPKRGARSSVQGPCSRRVYLWQHREHVIVV